MKLAKIMRKLGWLCFLLSWIPFGMIMFKGPLSIAMNGPEQVAESMSADFFGGMGIWIGLSTGLIILMAVLFVGSFIVGGTSNHRVISKGQDAEAKILALNDTGTRINDNPVVNFSLEVHPIGQPAFIAEANQTVSILYLPSYQPGKIVNVKYVPGTDKVAIVGVKNI